MPREGAHSTASRALTAVGMCILLTACGSQRTPDAIAGRTPAEVLSRVVSELARTPFRFTIRQTLIDDNSRLLPFVSNTTLHQTVSESVQNPTRFVGVTSYGGPDGAHFLEFDGKGYASADGTSWLAAPFLDHLNAGLVGQRLQDMVSQFDVVRDAGHRQINGTEAEHYDATASTAFLTTESRMVVTRFGLAFGASVRRGDRSVGAVHINNFKLGYDINRATGELLDATGTGHMAIDLDKLYGLVGQTGNRYSGVIEVGVDYSARISDFGKQVGINRPSTSQTMSVDRFFDLITNSLPKP